MTTTTGDRRSHGPRGPGEDLFHPGPGGSAPGVPRATGAPGADADARHRGGTIAVCAVATLLVVAWFLTGRALTTNAFEDIEEDASRRNAESVRAALDYEVRALVAYGMSNSLWDDSYDDVRRGDRDAFTAHFAPDELREVYELDGLLGVGLDGTLRVGGIADDSAYREPDASLGERRLLERLFDPEAPVGSQRCGLLESGSHPYLFCGFPSRRTDASGPVVGGFIVLKSLDEEWLDALGTSIGATVRIPRNATLRGGTRSGLRGSLGEMTVSVSTAGHERITLDVELATVTGSPLVVEASYPRPVHQAAHRVSARMALLTGGVATVLSVLLMVLVRRATRRRVRPLRTLTEAVIASGDRSLRVGATGTDDIAALGRAIDSMLDAIQTREEDLRAEQSAREQQQRSSFLQQRLSEQYLRRQSQVVMDETTSIVTALLGQVVEQAEAVLDTAGSIARSVSSASDVTQDVVEQSRSADEVLRALEQSLERVNGIAGFIATVAEQTNLLSLNATIEAARAGQAGKGFSVVAHEVKELATTTSRSTGEIARTIGALQTEADKISSVITGIIEGISGIRDATAAVESMVGNQRATVTDLGNSVNEAIAQVDMLAALSQDVERRKHPRVPTRGSLQLLLAGGTVDADLLDLSEGGMRCALTEKTSVTTDTRLTVLIHLRDDPPCSLEAQVLWRRQGEQGCQLGLTFLSPTPGDLAQIRDYVAFVMSQEEAELSP